MKNDTKRSANGRTGVKNGSQRIHFEFTSSNAESVAIAGTFNEWQPNATPMVALGQGRWAKDLALPPGDYEYCLVVDGQWMPDPHATETVPNPFGGVNTIRRVGNDASRNPVGVGTDSNAWPKVASLTRQPWAGGRT